MAARKKSDTYERVVGRNIARTRGASNLTQDELGEQIRRDFRGEWGKQTLSALENGKRPIVVSELLVIAEALGVDVPSLLTPTSEDGSPLPDARRLPVGNRGRTRRADQVRRVVAPTAGEGRERVLRELAKVATQAADALVVMPAVEATASVPKPATRKGSK